MAQQVNFPRKWQEAMAFGIGFNPIDVLSLRQMSVPPPDVSPGNTASFFYDLGNAHRVGDGYAYVNWIWDIISTDALYRMLIYLNGKYSNDVYIRTRITVETPHPADAFNIYSAVMIRPNLDGLEGTPIARTPFAYQTLQIQFRNLILVP